VVAVASVIVTSASGSAVRMAFSISRADIAMKLLLQEILFAQLLERFLIGRNQKGALTLLNCRIFCAEVAATSAENALAAFSHSAI
jgi:hypothetical protein